MGAPADVLARVENEQEDEVFVDVLEPNWTPVQVWMRCQPTIAPMRGTWGVAAAEVRAVCDAMNLHMDLDLLDQVRHMANVADDARSKKT